MAGVGHGDVDGNDLSGSFALEHLLWPVPFRRDDEESAALRATEGAGEWVRSPWLTSEPSASIRCNPLDTMSSRVRTSDTDTLLRQTDYD